MSPTGLHSNNKHHVSSKHKGRQDGIKKKKKKSQIVRDSKLSHKAWLRAHTQILNSKTVMEFGNTCHR